MVDQNWDWVEEREEKLAEERSKDYFNIVEGDNRFVLLTHFAPLAQVYDPSTRKYHIAEEGEKGASIKGVCWVWQDDEVKLAKMPYTVVKQVRDLRDDPEWDFSLPFHHQLTLTAKGAGTKEVEYSLRPSPKLMDIPADIVKKLEEKPSPEEMVEKMKGNARANEEADKQFEDPSYYPTDDIGPEDVPFR